MSLKTQAEQWKERMFKMIILFVVLGMIALGIAVTMVSKVFTDIVASPSFIWPM